jgi:hypothetical protein
MLLDQSSRPNRVTGGQGMLDGLVDQTVFGKPPARSGMEGGNLAGTEMTLELMG